MPAVVRRRVIGLGSLVLLAVLVWPAVHPGELDSLPVSSYPMFAHPRQAVSSFDLALHQSFEGDERLLGEDVVGGTGEPMQAAMTLRQAIQRGQAHSLCEEIGETVGLAGVVMIITARYDAVAWFRGEKAEVDRIVHASCETGGGS